MSAATPASLLSSKTRVWSHFLDDVASQGVVQLFLDYDGTIVPIKSTPERATLSNAMRRMLIQLHQETRARIVIVTGRSMEDITRLVRIPGMGFAANHGFHIRTDTLDWIHPSALEARIHLERFELSLRPLVQKYRGIFVEDKQYTLSVHYRKARIVDIDALHDKVLRAVAPYSMIRCHEGKKVFELRPNVHWNKGSAVAKILDTPSFDRTAPTAYIGDDETDEDAFQVLSSPALTIRVGGEGTSMASWYVRTPRQVTALLADVLTVLRKR